MTDPQPISATAASDYLRRAAKGLCSRHGGKPTQLLEWLAADLIERQERQIERMRAALAEVREIFAQDLDSYEAAMRALGETPDDNDAAYFAGMDELLRKIDEAMGESNEPR